MRFFPFVRVSDFNEMKAERDKYRALYHQLIQTQIVQAGELVNTALKRHGYAQIGAAGERESQQVIENGKAVWSRTDIGLYESWLAERMSVFGISRKEAEMRYEEEYGTTPPSLAIL